MLLFPYWCELNALNVCHPIVFVALASLSKIFPMVFQVQFLITCLQNNIHCSIKYRSQPHQKWISCYSHSSSYNNLNFDDNMDIVKLIFHKNWHHKSECTQSLFVLYKILVFKLWRSFSSHINDDRGSTCHGVNIAINSTQRDNLT